MSLAELLPDIRSLSRQDKLRLIQLVAEELARADSSAPIPAGQSYPCWSPDRAYDAAADLMQARSAEQGTAPAIQPRDEWERRLLGAASDCGVSLPHSALSSEGLYE